MGLLERWDRRNQAELDEHRRGSWAEQRRWPAGIVLAFVMALMLLPRAWPLWQRLLLGVALLVVVELGVRAWRRARPRRGPEHRAGPGTTR